jgi:hypothetical protein
MNTYNNKYICQGIFQEITNFIESEFGLFHITSDFSRYQQQKKLSGMTTL